MSRGLIKFSNKKTDINTLNRSQITYKNLLKTKRSSNLPFHQKQNLCQSSCRLPSQVNVFKTNEIKDFVKAFKKNQEKYSIGVNHQKDRRRLLKSQDNMNTQRISKMDKKEEEKEPQGILNNCEGQKNLVAISLEEYEKKIEQLIRMKLTKRYFDKSVHSTRIIEDEIEKQLKNLIEQVKEFQTSDPQAESSEQTITNELKNIDLKISILERVIAESYTQSEMMKKFYYAKKGFKKTHNNAKTPNKASASCEIIMKNSAPFQKSQAIYFRTNSQLSFTKPQRHQYEPKTGYNKKPYAPNRQCLPNSSYQDSYLNYGSLPIYRHRKSQNYIAIPGGENRSTYQGDFIEKKTNKFNNKSLDCRKDKFSQGKIPFMGKQFSTAPQNVKPKTSRKILQHSSNFYNTLPSFSGSLRRSEPFNLNSFNSLPYKTEYEWNFKGEKSSITNFIKDKNLSNLKMCFKNEAKA